MLKKIFAFLAGISLSSHANDANVKDLFSISLNKLTGDEITTLAAHKGKVILIVNVASKCGLTKQYAQLEALQKKYAEKGFTVVGIPCNQFGGQEPGTGEQIATFCSTTYGVTFPIYGKLDVNGPQRHPLYQFLAGDKSPFPGKIQWNFTKFLIGKDGKVIARFGPRTTPDAQEISAAIDAALK